MTIIQGIRNQHLIEIKSEDGQSEIDAKFVVIIWNMIIKFGGVDNLTQVPSLNDPDHRDVKLILTMYTLDSFLFKRLNLSCRQQDIQFVKNLGPFAIALT